MITETQPTIRLGGKNYPVVWPSIRDPRLHLASIIISIHILGQIGLGFEVTLPQILSAILASASIEVFLTFRRTGQLVWPASAMLTGSGVALIFRVIGTERGDHWGWSGWYLFALVGGLSLVTKYVIRLRGSHVFNPSNVGLVLAFLILGSERVEPLDFWWAPLDQWMVAAYLIILGGGLLITARLRLLAMATTFWLTLGAGLGLVAASGHCMTTAWALGPVCGFEFWRVVMISPEVLIFLFFMITDPKTIPSGSAARVAFAAGLALVCSFLIAPHANEFGAKVGLLAGLVVLTPLRLLFDRFLPDSRPAPGLFLDRLTIVQGASAAALRIFGRGAVAGASAVLVTAAIVAAGAPARVSAGVLPHPPAPELEVEIDPSTLPPVTVDPDVFALNSDIDTGQASELAVTLAENLAVEREALRRSDASLLRAVDHGARLIEMERRIEQGEVSGERKVSDYTFDSLHLDVVFNDGSQGGPSLALLANGAVREIIFDTAGFEQGRVTIPFAGTFVLNRAAGDRWLLIDVRPQP
ncbi:MAG: hypothetical protein ACRDWH_02250 [Acidimicrobiia bacterium]